jgi:hypothetical protein
VKEVLDRFELSDCRLVGITTDNASSKYSMTRKLQSTLEMSGMEWSALRNHIPCMAHVIQLCLGAFMSNLDVTGCTKSWEAHEHDRQFGENEGVLKTTIQKLQKIGNAQIHKVAPMNPGLAKIIEKVTTI